MNRTILCITILMVSLNTRAQTYERIVAPESTVTDTFYHHYIVEDKYRRMENVTSPETQDWLKSEEKLSKKYLAISSNKTQSYPSIDKYRHADFEFPHKVGDYYFTYAYYNDNNVPALFYQKSVNADPMIIVDPMDISSKNYIVIKDFSVSKDSKYMAFTYNRDGSDFAELKIVSLITRRYLNDHLTGLKFSDIVWRGNGFFYSTYEQQGTFGKTYGQKVFYHSLESEQGDDKLIFERNEHPDREFSFQTLAEERFFILKEYNKEINKINFYYIDYESETTQLRPLLSNISFDLDLIEYHNDKFIGFNTYLNNNGNIVEIDPSNLYNWREIVPEYKQALLIKAIPFADRMILIYKEGQHQLITIADYNGKLLHRMDFQLATTVRGFNGNPNDEEVLYSVSTYTIPPVVYRFNIKTFKDKPTKTTRVTFDYQNIEYKELECLTSDSVTIPMILVYEKGLLPDGNNPMILKAYGGFGVVEKPSFDPAIVHFIHEGGIYAFASIRGGGEKGIDWAKQGKGNHKQTSFDDFISAAEFLIEKKYTNPDKLAITGVSNGGLVVAAAAIQRPDLFKVVVPVVAPMDMIRSEQFTVGHFNTPEFGTTTDSASFINLLSYSPYQNIKEEINYPVMLVVTSENDDRVPPFHSYKFVARLQNRAAQTNPVLLKVMKDVGHYGSFTLSSRIKDKAEIFGFIMNELKE